MQELGPNWDETGRVGAMAHPCTLSPALLLPPTLESQLQIPALLDPLTMPEAPRGSPCPQQPAPPAQHSQPCLGAPGGKLQR